MSLENIDGVNKLVFKLKKSSKSPNYIHALTEALIVLKKYSPIIKKECPNVYYTCNELEKTLTRSKHHLPCQGVINTWGNDLLTYLTYIQENIEFLEKKLII